MWGRGLGRLKTHRHTGGHASACVWCGLQHGFLFTQVHLTEQNLLGRLAVLQVESVAVLVEEVSGLVEELNPLHAANHIQLALDRLAQALQVAMATGALLCSRGEWNGDGAFLFFFRISSNMVSVNIRLFCLLQKT